jgi:hypothetical protein
MYIETTIIFGILSCIIAFLTTIIIIKHAQYRKIVLKLSDKKYKIYSEIVTVLFDMINRQKKLSKFSDDELLKRIMNIKRDLLLYGTDKIIRKFFEWEDNQLTKKRLYNWVELAYLVRKDMGNKRTRIKPDDILESLLSEKDEFKDFKKSLLG